MAHNITFTIRSREIKNIDADFEIKTNGKKLGTLKVSRGSLDWTPAGFDDDRPHTISWGAFDKYMQGTTKRKK